MIRYALTCDRAHDFDSWFQSAEAFDGLLSAGMLACPDCGSPKVGKSLMAPQVRPADRASDLAAPANAKETALAALRQKIETTSEYVGLSFAAEARKIHDGEAPERSIYGEARLDEARKLVEDGVPVAPLPFLPRNKAN
jgi:hypothetical protein